MEIPGRSECGRGQRGVVPDAIDSVALPPTVRGRQDSCMEGLRGHVAAEMHEVLVNVAELQIHVGCSDLVPWQVLIGGRWRHRRRCCC